MKQKTHGMRIMKVAAVTALAVGLLLTGLPATGGAVDAASPKGARKAVVKNVILMISDGCGYDEIAATDYYQYGKTGKQVYESFPVQLGMSTYSVGSYDSSAMWGDFGYAKLRPTDSAAAATAMSTGFKTYDAAIGVGLDGGVLTHVGQRFEQLGKSTGVVSSVEFSHATPAGFVAHNASRNDYSAIAVEMLRSSATDVIMGAGNPFYSDSGALVAAPQYKYVGGQSTWDGLVNGTLAVSDADGDGISDPWTLIQDRASFQALAKGRTPDRVVGVAKVATTLQQSRSGDGKAAPYAVPFNTGVPTLAEMSAAALNVLDNNDSGFFLMIEGGAIDWAGHANQSGRLIEEEIDFNRAVEAVCTWVKKHSNWGETLLIVTGDHETGYLTGPGSNPGWNPIVNNGAGVLPGMQWNSGDHTNSLIPLFAKGDAARFLKNYADLSDPVRGAYVDNTEIAKLIFDIIE